MLYNYCRCAKWLFDFQKGKGSKYVTMGFLIRGSILDIDFKTDYPGILHLIWHIKLQTSQPHRFYIGPCFYYSQFTPGSPSF